MYVSLSNKHGLIQKCIILTIYISFLNNGTDFSVQQPVSHDLNK